MPHTIKLSNGDLLTGHSWRQDNTIFTALPFNTNVVCAKDHMDNALRPLFDLAKVECNGQVKSALMVCKKPFLLAFMI
jgi:hypothetical protein